MSLNHQYAPVAIQLLQSLIAKPSFSREEDKTAELIERFLQRRGVACQRQENNIWARSKYWEEGKPVLLLNSHHDTVKPVESWQRNPFEAKLEQGRLYGLGSNDAGASLVALTMAFLHFYEAQHLPFNIILAATAEEEISGAKGIAALLPELGAIDCGIVGEPTQLQMAVAEKGLMVIDGRAVGQAGHAARQEGENALYKAMDAIHILRQFQFDKISDLLGPTLLQVTQIQAGHQHNVVPDHCHFVIDIRTNERYSNQEVFNLLQDAVEVELKARSYRLNSSQIALNHPLVQQGLKLGMKPFGSPTLSDQALMPFPTLKLGCGDSARSHTADEYIQIKELEQGIKTYIHLLEGLAKSGQMLPKHVS